MIGAPSPADSSRDETYMGMALLEANAAAEAGDVPVGAVVVAADGRVLSRGRNRREVDGDPTSHAEIVAIRDAARAVGTWRLIDATLYVTLEPCAMCAGALVNCRIARVVYGCPDAKAGGVSSRYTIGTDDRLNHRFEVTSGVLADQSLRALQAFFRALRAAGEK